MRARVREMMGSTTKLLWLLSTGMTMDVGRPPDEKIAAIVDDVAAQFVAAKGRGIQGHEPPLLKAAARAYKEKLSSIGMPWPYPQKETGKIPNIIHWAWRSGDADWTLALSVFMARMVQKPDKIFIHTGPAGATETYTSPTTDDGQRALKCLNAAGAEEVRHREDPTPGNEHPWAEVKTKHLTKQAFAHVSDVMRLYTILVYGGIYLDRDAFLHRSLDDYREYAAVLGLDPETFEGDHDVNFGAFMAKRNSTYFQLLWNGMGLQEYKNLSYATTWGGWAHDSCRKSFALALKRPDLCHVTEDLYQFPFPGKGAGRGPRGRIPPQLLRKAQHPVLHMSGFEWHGARTEQLSWRPSIWGEILWPNVLSAASDQKLSPDLLTCLRWHQSNLHRKHYIDDDHLLNFADRFQFANVSSSSSRRLRQ